MSFFNKRTSSGVFVKGKNGFTEYKGSIGNGSINSIAYSLGYNSDQVYSPPYTDEKKQIYVVVLEIFSRNILFVVTSNKKNYLTEKEVNKYLANLSVRKEFDNLRVNEVLTDGVENGTLTIDFLAKVLKLKNVSRFGMFYSDRIKTYLYFTNGILTDFHFDDGLFPYAKYLKEGNKTVFDMISTLAYKYWPDNDFNAQREINIQCEAWANIPDAFGNEYINLHSTENGGANLHMLRVSHYGYSIDNEFFCAINHGRYEILEQTSSDYIKYKCGNYKYVFDLKSGALVDFEMI